MMRRYRDSEGIVHFTGPGIAVNSGLCGNNDHAYGGDEDDYSIDDEVDCAPCLSIVRYVKSNGRKE